MNVFPTSSLGFFSVKSELLKKPIELKFLEIIAGGRFLANTGLFLGKSLAKLSSLEMIV